MALIVLQKLLIKTGNQTIINMKNQKNKYPIREANKNKNLKFDKILVNYSACLKIFTKIVIIYYY